MLSTSGISIIQKRLLVVMASVLLLVLASLGVYTVAGERDNISALHSLELLKKARLTDQHGNKIRLKDLRDKVVLVNFFFTSCGGACPMQTSVVKDARSQLSADVDAVFLSVSIAPMLDTKETINAFIEKHNIDQSNWLFASTKVAETKMLVEKFGVTVDGATVVKDQIDHRNVGFLFGRNGNLMQQYQLVPGMSKRLAKEMKVLFDLDLNPA